MATGQSQSRSAAPTLLAAAGAAVSDVFSPPFRAVLVKSLALTVVGLALLGVAIGKLFAIVVLLPHAVWLATALHVVAYLAIFASLLFAVTPASFVVASFFFDGLAERLEIEIGGGVQVGRRLAFAQATWIGIEFALLSLGVNLAALLVSFVPGVNLLAFFGANAYLLGRGFFELAALRHRSVAEVRTLRRRHAGRIFCAGCLCAALAAVPGLNLLTPLFATALMVRVAWPLASR